MTEKDENQIDLDTFFEDAIEPPPELSSSLMANILADAGEISASRQVEKIRPPIKSWGLLARLMEPFGGIQGMAAVGLCTILGIAIGYAGTDTLQSIPGVGDIVASISSDPLDDFSYVGIASFNDFLAEG